MAEIRNPKLESFKISNGVRACRRGSERFQAEHPQGGIKYI
jgi:hypothetical protein